MEAIYAALIFATLVGNITSFQNNPEAYQGNLYTKLNSQITSLANNKETNQTETQQVAESNNISTFNQILGNSVETTPIITPTTTPTPILQPTSTTTPTPTLEPTPTIPAATYSNVGIDVVGTVERFAGEYGVDTNLMKHIATCESGFNPNAHNVTYDYAGLYQFGASTWISTRNRMGLDPNPDLRFSAEEAAKTAAFKIKHDGPGAWSGCL